MKRIFGYLSEEVKQICGIKRDQEMSLRKFLYENFSMYSRKRTRVKTSQKKPSKTEICYVSDESSICSMKILFPKMIIKSVSKFV